MPKQIHEEVGKLIRTHTVKTFGDKVKEALRGIAGLVFIVVVAVAIFG